jgi:phosphatidylserine/phosphatidylglycerophosphate/cardiolipin synthase-like enzyme
MKTLPSSENRGRRNAAVRGLCAVFLGMTLLSWACIDKGHPARGSDPRLADAALAEVASAGPLAVHKVTLVTDNDEAFRSKLRLIENAQSTIDMAYYLYGDDYSSSALSAALMDAVARGVRVRLLVDHHSNYQNLDLFSLLERNGAAGPGNLEVRFYNRPSARLVQDAAFMTLGCGDGPVAPRSERCDGAKYAQIDAAFAGEMIGGRPAASRNISNLNVAGSGLFLSGLYAKRPDVMALAVTTGQGIDLSAASASSASQLTPEQRSGLVRLGKIYWQSKVGSPLRRLGARIELAIASQLHGDQIDPLYNTLVSLLPLERRDSPESLQDWDHLTDFLHHKFLLVDGRYFQLGGRNVEDAYHMQPNPLVEKYLFMDTDAVLDLAGGGEQVRASFTNLWEFDRMVATLAEVRQHAPNDLIANLNGHHAAEVACADEKGKETYDPCVDREYQARFQDLPTRMDQRQQTLNAHARIYQNVYVPTIAAEPASPNFAVDRDASVFYLENLPFDRHLAAAERRRHYGARNGHEGEDGKAIHEVWLRSLAETCGEASPDRPRRVILHNAYFFPPADLIYAFAQMVSGEWECGGVTIDVLTNSVDTTDLSPINIAWRHAMKAFSEFYEKEHDAQRGATFAYHEYRARQGSANLSLHTKVSVFGDSLVVGSANDDVRSFMMDTNNGLYIRHAPQLVANYTRFVDHLLHDPAMTEDQTDYFRRTPRAAIIEEDKATLHQIMDKYRVSNRVTPEQQAELEARFLEALDRVYALATGSLRGGHAGNDAREEFNQLFKPL